MNERWMRVTRELFRSRMNVTKGELHTITQWSAPSQDVVHVVICTGQTLNETACPGHLSRIYGPGWMRDTREERKRPVSATLTTESTTYYNARTL